MGFGFDVLVPVCFVPVVASVFPSVFWLDSFGSVVFDGASVIVESCAFVGSSVAGSFVRY